MMDHLREILIAYMQAPNNGPYSLISDTVIACSVAFFPGLMTIATGSLLQRHCFFGKKKRIAFLVIGLTAIGFFHIALISYLLFTSKNPAAYTDGGINGAWPIIAIPGFFYCLCFAAFIRPHLAKAWYGNNPTMQKMITPKDGSHFATVYSHALMIKLWGSFAILSALVSLACMLLATIVENTTLHSVLVAGCFLFIITYFLHMLIVQSLLKCDHCHLNALDFSKQHYKYGSWARQVKTILFSNSFHCVCCGAYYALSVRTLKKHQHNKRGGLD